MWALQFFVYALIVLVLAMLFGGTMIGYYFMKRAEYEVTKAKTVADLLRKKPEN